MSKTSAKKDSIVGSIIKRASERSGFHVIPHNDGWVVKKEGTAKSSAKFGSKDDAISAASQIKNKGGKAGEIVIHNRTGQIEGFIREENGRYEAVVVHHKTGRIEGKVKR